MTNLTMAVDQSLIRAQRDFASAGVGAVALLLAAVLAGCGGREAREPVTFDSQLQVLTDPLALCRMDRPGAALASSFDPAGGNDDFNHPLRPGPEGWVVLADLKGPGCMTRFWFTGADNGTHPLRFYFDGETQPRLETTLDRFCGNDGVNLSPVAAYEPFCWYTLAPLPYRSRLVVMTRAGATRPDGSPKLFFQINSCRFPRGTVVNEVAEGAASAVSNAIQAARLSLLKTMAGGPNMELSANASGATNALLALAAGMRASVALPAGPAILRQIVLRPDLTAFGTVMERDAALRQVVLRVYWEGASQPSVEAPLGDIFGSVWRARPFRAFYFGMTNGAYFIRFPMPYRNAARLELENLSAKPVSCAVELRTEALPGWTPGKLGYFHAAWNKSGPERMGQPHTILQTAGRGRYVGCILAVTSLDKSWWILEGDESMRVDGEPNPSWHGTGLEDYFNGGWYYGRPIVRPFHGLLCKSHFRTVQYRIHQTDAVAFKSGARVEIERGPDNASHGWLESVAFYYQDVPMRATSALGSPAWRATPDDSLRPVVRMTEINDAELLDDYEGAEALARETVESWRGYPYVPVMQLRLLLYRERREGWPAVRETVAQFQRETSDPLARTQAEDWIWYHASPSNALLAAYSNSRTDVWLDGQLVGVAGDPSRVQVWRVLVAPGKHALSLQSDYHSYPFWAQACLRTHTGDVYTSPDWRSYVGPPAGWAAAEFDDAAWTRIGGPEIGKGPPEEPWIGLEPYAFIGLQSHARGVSPANEWSDRRQRGVMRHAFEIGGKTAE